MAGGVAAEIWDFPVGLCGKFGGDAEPVVVVSWTREMGRHEALSLPVTASAHLCVAVAFLQLRSLGPLRPTVSVVMRRLPSLIAQMISSL